MKTAIFFKVLITMPKKIREKLNLHIGDKNSTKTVFFQKKKHLSLEYFITLGTL